MQSLDGDTLLIRTMATAETYSPFVLPSFRLTVSPQLQLPSVTVLLHEGLGRLNGIEVVEIYLEAEMHEAVAPGFVNDLGRIVQDHPYKWYTMYTPNGFSNVYSLKLLQNCLDYSNQHDIKAVGIMNANDLPRNQSRIDQGFRVFRSNGVQCFSIHQRLHAAYEIKKYDAFWRVG